MTRLFARTLMLSTGFAALLGAAPVLAQTSTNTTSTKTTAGTTTTTAPVMAGTAKTAPAIMRTTAPAPVADKPAKADNTAPKGGLVMTHGALRSSALVGATVYDATGTSIGTVDDILVGPTGKMSDAVLSVGGFLGMGDKLVEVPFSKLKIEPSKSNPESGAADTSNGNRDYSLVLPHASKASLKTMTAFTYDEK